MHLTFFSVPVQPPGTYTASTGGNHPFVPHTPRPPRVRVIIVALSIVLLTLGTLFLILNILGTIAINIKWVQTVTLIINFTGLICAIGQWLLPVSPSSSMERKVLRTNRELFRRQIEQELDFKSHRGSLIVYMDEHEVGHDLFIVSQHLWVQSQDRDHIQETRRTVVKRYSVNDHYVCAAVFRSLESNDYMLWLDVQHPTSVFIRENEVMSLDWR